MTFLLNHTANGTTENIDQRIQEWIQKQVPKLKGSPLAAVEIGEDLKKKTTSQEKCDIFDDIERHLGSVYRAHLFTYHHLPPHLQRCFQFCSIFPNNCKFEHDKLTKMWMALGFVEEKAHALVGNGVRNMEHVVARGYFDDLVDRSLFQLEQSKGGGDKHAHYMIYEQIHWMLRLASDKNCISIPRRSTAPKSIPETVRHLSVASNCLDLLKLYPSWELNKMRTLLVLENDDGSMSSTFNKGILKLFKGVRVLDLTAKIGLTHLLRTIHNLKHVRYLDIDMACIANISGIGRMAKLQGPIEFKAIRASEKEGHAVLELEGMDSLRGMLSIKGLDAVAGKEEAIKARLEQKSAVKVLKLEWGPTDLRRVNGGPADFDAVAVLEGLQPHRDLHELRITRYPGAASPSWLGVKMEKLVYLYLRNCRRLTAMPVLGELPCLELLDVKELPCVKRIEGGFRGAGTFPKLKKVVLDDMPRLLAWGDMPKLAFPRLTEVSIVDCPRLSSLSGLERCAGSLSLRVKGCPRIIEVTLKAITGVSTYKFH